MLYTEFPDRFASSNNNFLYFDKFLIDTKQIFLYIRFDNFLIFWFLESQKSVVSKPIELSIKEIRRFSSKNEESQNLSVS